MPLTLAQKLIARACGRDEVQPDEIVTCRVDLLMMHDLQGPRRVGPMLERLGADIWDRDRVVVVSDHNAPAIDIQTAGVLDFTRKWVKSNGIRYQFSPIPAHLARMLRDGGLLPHLEKRFAAAKHGGAPR